MCRDFLVCSEGFYESGGICVPIPDCGVGNVWNGSACEPIPDPPLCNPPKVIIGDQCMLPPDPDDPCPAPNVLVDGMCVPPCPSGLSRIEGVCKCPEGKVYIDGQCKDPECNHPLGTLLGGEGQYTSASYDGGLFCYSPCVVYPSFSGRDPISGQWFANGPLFSTGAACTGSGNGPTGGGPEDPSNPGGGDPPPPEEPPKSCPKGRCPGSVNGTMVCVPCSDTSSSSSGSTSPGGTNPGDGSGGTGGQPGTGNGEGTSTSTQTHCKDGKCTTTTTTTTTDGEGNQSQATETKEETKEDFCTQNPKSPHCVEGSFGGACDAGFSCEGDPVACATAKAANEQACMLKVDPANTILGIGNNALGGGNGEDHPRGLTVTHDIGVLDQTNPWGGSCPGDIQVPVMGITVTIPLSELCTALQAMGAIAVAFTLMAAAFIVVKGT